MGTVCYAARFAAYRPAATLQHQQRIAPASNEPHRRNSRSVAKLFDDRPACEDEIGSRMEC